MWFDNDLYGNYRTRTFADIFPNETTFSIEYASSPLGDKITAANSRVLYYLLYARYGNSSVASFDETQFKYKIWSIIFQYGPAWQKKLSLQQTLQTMTQADMLKGARLINNHVANPGDTASSAGLEELTGLDDQNQTLYKKGLLEGYDMLIRLLEDDVSEQFLRRFERLFIQFVKPEVPLWYVSEEE